MSKLSLPGKRSAEGDEVEIAPGFVQVQAYLDASSLSVEPLASKFRQCALIVGMHPDQRVGLASPLLSCHAVFFLRNFLNDACQTASLSFPSLNCVSIFPPSPAPTSAPTTCRIWGATGFCFAYRAHDPKKSTGSVCLT